jgi:hypothetical protein
MRKHKMANGDAIIPGENRSADNPNHTYCPQCKKEVFEGSAICGNCGSALNGTIPVIAKVLERTSRSDDTEELNMKKQSLDALHAPDEVAESIQNDYRRLGQDITDQSGFDTKR